jgi:hypothetical protein
MPDVKEEKKEKKQGQSAAFVFFLKTGVCVLSAPKSA